ncbi:MAG: hypothetical protein R2875_08255 [Desulfobacterales bacterium]
MIFPISPWWGSFGAICLCSFPDFAGELTFQVLAQVRPRGPGKPARTDELQTYNPDHFSIIAATSGTISWHFYNQEIAFRKALDTRPLPG